MLNNAPSLERKKKSEQLFRLAILTMVIIGLIGQAIVQTLMNKRISKLEQRIEQLIK